MAFIGAGPGDENLLTLRAAALIGRADLVVAPQWVADRLGHLLKPGATLADSDAQLADPKLLIKAARAGQLAVRLFAGDPFMFCGAAADAVACAKARVPFEVVPGRVTGDSSTRVRGRTAHHRRGGRRPDHSCLGGQPGIGE